MSSDKENWHLDKRVPVAIVFTLVVQLVGFAFMYGRLESRVAHIEDQQRVVTLVPERLARLEALLERIERQLAKDRP